MVAASADVCGAFAIFSRTRVKSPIFFNDLDLVGHDRNDPVFRLPLRVQRSLAHPRLRSRVPSDSEEEEEEEDNIIFDDFDDFVAGSSPDDATQSSSSLWMQSLTERIQESRHVEMQADARLAKNWRTGNWNVRGFLLDKVDPVREAVADTARSSSTLPPRRGMKNTEGKSNEIRPIHISTIVADQAAEIDGEIFETIAVGRTDGTVLIVQLGSEYLTKFTAVPNLIVDDSSTWTTKDSVGNSDVSGKDDDLAKTDGTSVTVETKLVNSEKLKNELTNDPDFDLEAAQSRGEKENPGEDPYGELYGVEEIGNQQDEERPDPGTPFEVVHQFRAHEPDQDISSLVFDSGSLYTAGGESGEIRVWNVPETSTAQDSSKMIPRRTLSEAHSDRIVSLKTLSSSGDDEIRDLLFSASRDGTFALWDNVSGDLVSQCQILDDSSEPVTITCADVDVSGANGQVIYIGLRSGHVVGYFVKDIIVNASAGGVCPIPSCHYLAHEASGGDEGGVTSILAMGQGTMRLSMNGPPTTSLLTGGGDGKVKQW